MAEAEPRANIPSTGREVNSDNSADHFEELLSQGPLKNLSPEQKSFLQQTLTRIEISASRSISYSGPLPHPFLLGKFNEAIPNGAERIMVMTEKQLDHRIRIETTVVNNQQRQSAVGQYFALFIAFTGLMRSGWLINGNHDTAGSTIGVTTIGSLAIAFINGRAKQRADLEIKQRAVEAVRQK